MTDTKLKRIYAERLKEAYCKGALSVCDILQTALAEMPDKDAKLTVQDFMGAVAMAKQVILVNSRAAGARVGQS